MTILISLTNILKVFAFESIKPSEQSCKKRVPQAQRIQFFLKDFLENLSGFLANLSGFSPNLLL